MSNKTTGIRLENRIKHQWEDDGWVVLHTRGSMGFVDLICLKGMEIKFLSIKRAALTKYVNKRIRQCINAVPDSITRPITIIIWDAQARKYHSKEFWKGSEYKSQGQGAALRPKD